LKYRVAQKVLEGEHLWLEEGTMELVGPKEAVRPRKARSEDEVPELADPGRPEPVRSS